MTNKETIMRLADAYATQMVHAHYHPMMEARAALEAALDAAGEPVAYMHPTLPKAISVSDLMEQPANVQLAWTKGTKLYLAPPAERRPLTDEQIMDIAKNPMTTPCSPWWLKDEVMVGDVRNAALVFARAIEAAIKESK